MTTSSQDTQQQQPKSGCPVNHTQPPKPSGCPVNHGNKNDNNEALNPLTMMPNIPQTPVPGQTVVLSTSRTVSSIPKSASPVATDSVGEHTGNMSDTPEANSGKWEYPSEQQFFSALHRKQKPAPAESIPHMLSIHNQLNDETWSLIRQWEQKYHKPCAEKCGLVRFMGRPSDLSPLAWFYMKFMGADRPFDRHDWIVSRCGQEVRYVIDYYSAPDDPTTGLPTFSVVARPAVDSVSAVVDRMREWIGGFWNRNN